MKQRVAIPAYFSPSTPEGQKFWGQLIAAAPVARLAVFNPNSGPGEQRDPAYASVLGRCKTCGVLTAGYVHTSYGQRPLAKVTAEIDKYMDWYSLEAILVDEVCSGGEMMPYYQTLHDYIKSRPGRANEPQSPSIILNPGTNCHEGYALLCDILLNFEGPWTKYKCWVEDTWIRKYPSEKFWHLVYHVDSSQFAQVIATSKARNAGWIYVTSATLPNPWDKLPDGSSWNDLLAQSDAEAVKADSAKTRLCCWTGCL